ncbi:calmodulin-binding protein 25-like [Musa acuminata AAA Group]|uniref:calmodulin-binding protein 25-like n=1 Tax=Musa acuminata AAA Group TaxID=214697 RepID=UPI0031D3CF07
MADNCSVLDPWMYRFESAWISEAFARDNDALTRALRTSISDTSSSGAGAPSASPDTPSAATSPNPLLLSRRHQLAPRNPLGAAPAGRVSKRKSRSSKRSPTTYINADPAHFREMVQRITGVRLDGELAEPLVKPEPVRPAVGARAALQYLCLPTLDTSAFLLDQRTADVGDGGSLGPPPDAPAFDLAALLSPVFPTLESWGVM